MRASVSSTREPMKPEVSACPATRLDSLLASQSAAFAISAGNPDLPSGSISASQGSRCLGTWSHPARRSNRAFGDPLANVRSRGRHGARDGGAAPSRCLSRWPIARQGARWRPGQRLAAIVVTGRGGGARPAQQTVKKQTAVYLRKRTGRLEL